MTGEWCLGNGNRNEKRRIFHQPPVSQKQAGFLRNSFAASRGAANGWKGVSPSGRADNEKLTAGTVCLILRN